MSEDTTPHRRFRFSLLNLVLLMTIVAMAFALWRLDGKLAPLRAENTQLRNEAGFLTITDPTRAHAIRLRTESPFFWKWKIMVPEGEHWCLHGTVGEIPARDNHSALLGSGVGIRPNEWGEAIVLVKAYRDLTDEWVCDFIVEGGGSVRERLSEAQAMALQEVAGRNDWDEVTENTKPSEPGKPFILLRRRLRLPNDQGSIWDAGPGVVAWLAPTSPIEGGAAKW